MIAEPMKSLTQSMKGFYALALSLFTSALFAADDIGSGVDGALSDFEAQVDTSGTKVSGMMNETTVIAKWVINVLWIWLPMILFPILIFLGIWYINSRKETASAFRVFGSIAVGAIAYFAVLAIFFNQ